MADEQEFLDEHVYKIICDAIAKVYALDVKYENEKRMIVVNVEIISL